MSKPKSKSLKPVPRPIVCLSFCCNNANTGRFEGRFSAVHIGDGLMSLESKYWPPDGPKLAYHFRVADTGGWGASPAQGHVKISRRTFDVLGYKWGWGNWCWDLLVVTPEVAEAIIDYLKTLDCFACESGMCDFFFDEWDNDGPLPWDEARRQLLREYGRQRA